MDDTNVARDRPAPASTHPLAHVRRAHGWSYQDLARVIAEHARALGVPMAARREKVWRWEHWGVIPEADSQRALARALGISPREIERHPWPRWLPAHGTVPDGLPWTPEGSRTALGTLLDEAPVPGDFPAAEGSALKDIVADWDAAMAASADPAPGGHAPAGTPVPAQRPEAAPRARGPRPSSSAPAAHYAAQAPGARPLASRVPEQAGAPGAVDRPLLEWLEAGVLGLRQLDDRFGGAAVRHRVDADLRVVAAMLDRRPQPPAVERRLLRTAADLAQLAGRAAAETGCHASAQRCFLTGLRLAHACGDRALAVALWGSLSLQAVVSGRAEDGVTAAEAAVRAAGGTPARVRALAASRLARAHAALGAEGAFRRAAAEAERQLAAAGSEPGPAWLYRMDHAELTAQTGLALLDLGLPHEARTRLDTALAAIDPARVRDRALYSARTAHAHALTGDQDGARTLAREAARLSRHCSSSNLRQALAPLAPFLTSDRPVER